MLVAKQVGKHASVYFIFGIFAHICFFCFCFNHLCHDAVRKNIFVHILGYLHNHTCMLSHVMHNYVCTYLREKNLNFRPHRWT